MDRARKFYETVFENKLDKLEGPDVEMYSFPMETGAPGSPGSLVKMEGFPVGKNSVLVYFTKTAQSKKVGSRPRADAFSGPKCRSANTGLSRSSMIPKAT